MDIVSAYEVTIKMISRRSFHVYLALVLKERLAQEPHPRTARSPEWPRSAAPACNHKSLESRERLYRCNRKMSCCGIQNLFPVIANSAAPANSLAAWMTTIFSACAYRRWNLVSPFELRRRVTSSDDRRQSIWYVVVIFHGCFAPLQMNSKERLVHEPRPRRARSPGWSRSAAPADIRD